MGSDLYFKPVPSALWGSGLKWAEGRQAGGWHCCPGRASGGLNIVVAVGTERRGFGIYFGGRI